MDIVLRPQRGEISRSELVEALMVWQYEPQYKTTGLADDREERPNSFDAVEYAFIADLIDEHDHELIFRRLAEGDSR